MTAAKHDVVIIGSGPGGAACAWRLVSQGIKVTLLEAGKHYNPAADYKLEQADWELHEFPAKSPTHQRQVYGEMQLLEEKYSDLKTWNHIQGFYNQGKTRKVSGYQHVVGVGGSSLHFTGEAHRMNPAAMQMKTRFDVAADWPMTYADLEPYYTIAETIVGVAGLNDDPYRWRSQDYPLPAHEINYGSHKILKSGKALGLEWRANSLAILSRPYDQRPACNHCNHCTYGCPRRDKGSADVTFMHKAINSDKLNLVTQAQVTRILTGDKDRISAVEFIDEAGRLHKLETSTVVLAAGAVETPRILINSSCSQAPQGLANESGELGRNFMETLYVTSSGLHAEALGSHRGIPSDIICWDYNAPDAIEGVIGGCRFSSAIAETALMGPVNYAKRVVPGWGHEHKKAMRESFGKALAVGAIGESLPHPNTYVDVDADQLDEHGLPKARIHSYLDEMALKRLDFMASGCRDILMASGVESVMEQFSSYDFFSSTHVFGTCRMGHDSSESVVNAFGQSHRWQNLFIADASVFPSSGGGEAPSLTIEALAIRTADYICQFQTEHSA